jgi:hypothetical protein
VQVLTGVERRVGGQILQMRLVGTKLVIERTFEPGGARVLGDDDPPAVVAEVFDAQVDADQRDVGLEALGEEDWRRLLG